jgi:hypothetical protein
LGDEILKNNNKFRNTCSSSVSIKSNDDIDPILNEGDGENEDEGDASFDDIDEEGEDDEDYDDGDVSNCDSASIGDPIAKFGFDYKTLLTPIKKKNDNGSVVELRPPLNASLFFNTPPTINFVTHQEKCKQILITL